MHEDGIEEAVSIVLAPHFSTFSIQSYNGRAQEEAEKLGGPKFISIESWYDEPKFVQYWSEQIQKTFQRMDTSEKENAVVIFSAHSLPEKIIQMGDPYPEQIKRTAELIADHAGLREYAIGWQSAGNTLDPWIGPDVQDLTKTLFEQKGYQSFIYAPVGFVSDHLEVLYDNDVECKIVTDQIGATYYRPEMPNVQPQFIDALATVVLKQIGLHT
jgi:ferrochelatase